MANQKGFLKIPAVLLVLGMVLAGCTNPANMAIVNHTNQAGNDDNNGGDGNNGGSDTSSVVYITSTADGKTVELTIIQPLANRALVSLPNGSTYVLKIDGVVVSKGTVVTGADGTAVFTSEQGYSFTAEIRDDSVAILTTVITDTGETIALPDDFRREGGNYHDGYPFVLVSDNTLSINIFGRGDGVSFLPTDPRCDKWVLQDDESKGVFPIGKWVNNTDEEEFIFFTASTMTRVSPWFDTYCYDYTINGTNLVLANGFIVPYIPTIEEQEYIDHFHSVYETSFRQARPWIPATSTISPQARKTKTDVGDGRMLGIDFGIVDHPDMTFVNDPDVIGTWEVADFVHDPAEYDPAVPRNPNANSWQGLKFEANGVLREKYYSGDWSEGGSSWTNGLLQTGSTAPEYAIETYAEGMYIFVQWKSGDYTVRADKPWYYVFKKTT